MKPTKNRVYCNDCGRTKMLFTEQCKADNFIKFNAEAIEEEGNKVPVRSYFCSSCGGWHVTSNPNAESFANGSWYEHIITHISGVKAPRRENSAMKELLKLALEGLAKAETWLENGNIKKAKASAFQWVKTMTERGVRNPYPFRKANLIIAKAGCALMIEVNTLLDNDNLCVAKSKMACVEECLKQIADAQELHEYKDALTKALSKANEKAAALKHRNEMQRKLSAINKEVSVLEHSMGWASLYDLLSDIPVLTRRLTEIDQDCVSHDMFREVVCRLYDIREKINASLASVA